MVNWRTRYRIVVYRDYEGTTWYRPEMKSGLFGRWRFGRQATYREAYSTQLQAEGKMEEWKVAERKFRYGEKVINVIYDDKN